MPTNLTMPRTTVRAVGRGEGKGLTLQQDRRPHQPIRRCDVQDERVEFRELPCSMASAQTPWLTLLPYHPADDGGYGGGFEADDYENVPIPLADGLDGDDLLVSAAAAEGWRDPTLTSTAFQTGIDGE